MNINSLANNIPQSAKSLVSKMNVKDALLPVILLEACVTGGRTYHAYKRDGFVEARERLTEETLGALFWIGGVKFFSKIGDNIGKKFLKLGNLKFDAGHDTVRNPMLNYIYKIARAANIVSLKAKKSGNSVNLINKDMIEKTLVKFKFGKALASVLLANACIGFVVPKINQKITKNYLNSINNLNKIHPELLRGDGSMDEFIQKTNKNSQNVSFKGQNGVKTLLSIVNKFETNNTYQLLSTDVGVAGGRAYNARNKHERIEVLFRDIGSLYFYMFSRRHINAILNKMQDKRTTRLDPLNAEYLNKYLYSELEKAGGSKTKDKFIKDTLGLENEVPDELPYKFEKAEGANSKFEKIKSFFSFGKQKTEDIEIIKLDDFINQCNKTEYEKQIKEELIEKAKKMAKLQPAIQSKEILTKGQVQDLYREGIIYKPEFLQEFYSYATSEKPAGKFMTWFNQLIGKKPDTAPKSIDPMTYVSKTSLLELKAMVKDYVGDIVKAAKDGEVTLDLLNKVEVKNFWKSAVNMGVGFVISAYVLSTVIPKVQYWITKKQTGEDKFPGTTTYND